MKKRRLWVPVISVIFVVAALLDIKYEGVGYQLLPDSVKEFIK
ncbi:hypothetical protein [Halalkalibacillus sediminis]|nr:hypothetical protein [Halalkalibacillus sediminis]